LNGPADSQERALMFDERILKDIARAYNSLVASSEVSVAAGRIGWVGDLLPAETALVSRATDERRLEFAAGRWCARRALEQIGGPAVPILRGRLGNPTWPPGFAGSITHDGGVAAAAAYRVTRPGNPRLAIDLVDCSGRSRLADIAPAILSNRDKSQLGYRIDCSLMIAEVFSAKEAAVKILSADLDRLVEFTEISVSPSQEGWFLAHPESSANIYSYSLEVSSFLATVALCSGYAGSGGSAGGRAPGGEAVS
jgi:4'-phosphopantetheinyl transferase EntD